MSEQKRNPLGQCMECWRRNRAGVPPMLWVSMLTSVVCWMIGPAYITLALAGAIIVLLLLKHMQDTPEE